METYTFSGLLRLQSRSYALLLWSRESSKTTEVIPENMNIPYLITLLGYFLLIVIVHELGHIIGFVIFRKKPIIKIRWWGVSVSCKGYYHLAPVKIYLIAILGVLAPLPFILDEIMMLYILVSFLLIVIVHELGHIIGFYHLAPVKIYLIAILGVLAPLPFILDEIMMLYILVSIVDIFLMFQLITQSKKGTASDFVKGTYGDMVIQMMESNMQELKDKGFIK